MMMGAWGLQNLFFGSLAQAFYSLCAAGEGASRMSREACAMKKTRARIQPTTGEGGLRWCYFFLAAPILMSIRPTRTLQKGTNSSLVSVRYRFMTSKIVASINLTSWAPSCEYQQFFESCHD
jgi:hypothetical protein